MLFNRKPRLDLTDKVVVITGAGSGIGRALAGELTRRGANVAISDWNPESVAETAGMIQGNGKRVLVDLVMKNFECKLTK